MTIATAHVEITLSEKERRRILSTAWHVLATSGEEQIRALDRLSSLASIDFALDVWLLTKPERALVDRVISRILLSQSPLRSMTPYLYGPTVMPIANTHAGLLQRGML